MKFKEYIQKMINFIRKREKSSTVKLERIDSPNSKADARVTFSYNERCKDFRKKILERAKKMQQVTKGNLELAKEDEELQQ